ncbi:hypothetical protein [Ensifer sp. 1H6]|uniref:hypothetical protein n=1 Tax=Ensifer sp. 1H6 TaxID=1911585 RepID=UPI0009D3BE87|nr:hypothetical protein [Ensifer sp. 1H6]OMQ44923.1 hypothetical protein BKP54_11050 [Ensifer sp. 1H6]
MKVVLCWLSGLVSKVRATTKPPSVTVVYNIDARGADPTAIARLERRLAERDLAQTQRWR